MLIFDGGMYDSNFNTVAQQQQTWLKRQEQKMLHNLQDETSMNFLHNLLQQQERGIAPTRDNGTTPHTDNTDSNTREIQLFPTVLGRR
jgi:hypothetical protein